MFQRLREDIACIRERDPAARSTWEVLTCYPGLHAVVIHRWAHACWRRGFRWLGRFLSHLGRFLTGIRITSCIHNAYLPLSEYWSWKVRLFIASSS